MSSQIGSWPKPGSSGWIRAENEERSEAWEPGSRQGGDKTDNRPPST
jgi:hypothetical protein